MTTQKEQTQNAKYESCSAHEPLPGIKRGTTGNLSVRNQHRLSAVS